MIEFRILLHFKNTIGRGHTEWPRQTDGRRFLKNDPWPPLRRSTLLFALIVLFLLPAPLPAREDNAHLVFKKTAGLRSTRVYIVKKGESLGSIFRKQQGGEPVPYALIRQLNPGIRNLNRIYPGQRILLPARETSEPPEPPADIPQLSDLSPSLYRIKEGDSISRIILSALKMKPSDALPTYRLIRRLNPEIKDLNRLQVGQTLRLPPTPARPAAMPAAPLENALRPEEEPGAKTTTKPASTDDRLGMIRPVVKRMRGAVTSTGSYFIPLQHNSQITIDCSMIPVVELDDGTTVLLDYGNRLSDNLKELIQQVWKSTAFLTANELRDDLGSLQGIIRQSRDYRMVKTDKPLTLFAEPEILLFPDWLIVGKETAGGAPYRQALFLPDSAVPALPPEIKTFLEKSGVTVTELTPGAKPSSDETGPKPQPAVVDMREVRGIALAEKLLRTLGETPLRNEEVAVFDETRNGFHLSITADLLLRRGGKRFILQTKKLPEQFISILREAGTEVIPIAENGQGRPLIEGVLHGVGIPVSYGFFLFRIPEEGQHPRLTASFSALRAESDGGTLYLVDFDLPPAGMPFPRNGSQVRIGRY